MNHDLTNSEALEGWLFSPCSLKVETGEPLKTGDTVTVLARVFHVERTEDGRIIASITIATGGTNPHREAANAACNRFFGKQT